MNSHTSVFTEVELGRGVPCNRVVEKFLPAFRAEIKTQLLVDIITESVALGIIHAFQDIMDFGQVIAISFLFIHIAAFHCRIHFHADDIAECVLWIDKTFTAVA